MGSGYGTEIVAGIVGFAFEKLNHSELRATIYPENVVSQRVLRKFGFEIVPWDNEDSPLFVLT